MKAFTALLDIVPGWMYALICAGLFGWGWINDSRVNSAQAEIAEIRADRAEQETDRVRELGRELTRMVGITNNLNEAYRVQSQTIDDLERRARTDGVRVTKARRDAAIAQGSAEAVRHYASVAGDVYQACRDEYRALGYDAARGSAAARALKQWVDQWPSNFDEAMTMQVEILKGTAK